jgi:hypothetical protein
MITVGKTYFLNKKTKMMVNDGVCYLESTIIDKGKTMVEYFVSEKGRFVPIEKDSLSFKPE